MPKLTLIVTAHTIAADIDIALNEHASDPHAKKVKVETLWRSIFQMEGVLYSIAVLEGATAGRPSPSTDIGRIADETADSLSIDIRGLRARIAGEHWG